MARNWNVNQRHVIDWRNSDMLVSAAAGSGKTAALVERILHKIVDDHVDINKMIVVTFTKAAAGEMKERLTDALYAIIDEEGKKKVSDQNLVEHLERQITLLGTAQITTIDSFCQYIIKNYFYVVQELDPGFKIIEEDEAKILLSDTVDELLEMHYTEYAKDPDSEESKSFAALVDFFSSWKNDDNVKKTLIKIHDKCITAPVPEKWLEGIMHDYSETLLTDSAWMRDEADYICKNIKACIEYAERAREFLSQDDELSPWLTTIEDDIRKLKGLITFSFAEDDGYIPTLSELYDNFLAFYNSGGFLGWNRNRIKDEDLKMYKDSAKVCRDFYAGKNGMIFNIWAGYINPDGTKHMLENILTHMLRVAPEKKKSIIYGFSSVREYLNELSPEGVILKCMSVLRPYIETLLGLVLELRENFSAAKRALGVVDFNDLEHMALNILSDIDKDGELVPSETAKMLGAYYNEIMIDEYQDSNRLQESILRSISDNNMNLFMVGDVKQSIYSFRNAVPQLFMDKQKEYEAEKDFENADEALRKGKQILINLDMNYRSRKEVLDFTNSIFRGLMSENFGGIEYDDAAMLKYGKLYDTLDWSSENFHTELILVDSSKGTGLIPDGDNGNKVRRKLRSINMKTIELEAVAVGKRIKELVSGDEKLLISGKDENGNDIKRNLKYKDIAILLRSNEADAVRKILTEMEIPVYSEAKDGYFERAEIMTMLDFLRIIDNPLQDIPLVSVLHSELFMFDENELALIKIHGGNGEKFYDRLKGFAASEYAEENENLKNKIQYFLDELAALRDESAYMSLYELVEKIYTDYDYYNKAGQYEDGDKRQANLDLMMTKARSFAEKDNNSLNDFIHFIESIEEEQISYGEAVLTTDDAVNIMTIHKSKGLEFPVVFLCHMEKRFNLSDSNGDVILDSDAGLGITLFDSASRLTSKWNYKNYIASCINTAAKCEEMRVLYVALTRAREKLFVVGSFEANVSETEKNKASDPIAFIKNDYRKKLTDFITKYKIYSSIKSPLMTANNYQSWILKGVGGEMSLTTAFLQYIDMTDKKIDSINEGLDYIPPGVHITGNGDSTIDVTIESFEYLTDFYTDIKARPDEAVPEKETDDLDDERGKEINDTSGIFDESLWDYEYPFMNKKGYPLKVSVSFLKASEHEFENDIYITGNDVKSEPGISGAEIGTAYHKVMQKMRFTSISDYEDEKFGGRFLDDLRDRGFFTDEIRQSIKESVISCFAKQFHDSPVLKGIVNADKKGLCFKEQPFMKEYLSKDLPVYLAKNDADTDPDDHRTLVQGVIDLYYIDDDGKAVIVDYKTDGIRSKSHDGLSEILIERYKKQFDYYTEAVESLEGIPVKSRYIYSLALGRFIEI